MEPFLGTFFEGLRLHTYEELERIMSKYRCLDDLSGLKFQGAGTSL